LYKHWLKSTGVRLELKKEEVAHKRYRPRNGQARGQERCQVLRVISHRAGNRPRAEGENLGGGKEEAEKQI